MIRTMLERAVSAHGARLALSGTVGVTDFWTYNELFDRIRATAEELTNVASDEIKVAVQLNNCVENVVLQLACGYVGAPLHTFKTHALLRAGVAARATRVSSSDKPPFSHAAHQAEVPPGGAAWDGAPKLYHLGRGDSADLLGLDAPARAAVPAARAAAAPHAAAAEEAAAAAGGGGVFYNSAPGVSYAALAAQGAAVSAALALAPGDALAVPVTLNHAFGMAGLLAAVQAGSCVLLPSPAPDAGLTLQALRHWHGPACLLADTHTLEALEGYAAPASLRGGLVKVGSGDALGEGPPVLWAGVAFATVGKVK